MKKISYIIERKLSSIILWVLTILALFLIIILIQKQPIYQGFEEAIPNQSTQIYSKVFEFAWDVSIGFIISLIFYLIVVYIPEKQKRKDVEKVINSKCENVIFSSYLLINEIIKNSRLDCNYKTLNKSEMIDICNAVNPLDHKYKFAHRLDSIYESHFGYKIANDWKRIVSTIDEILIYIPLIDTGLLNRLYTIHEHFLKHVSKDLEISDKVQINSLGSLSDTFYDFYVHTKNLRDYYHLYSKSDFANDPWK